MNKFMIKIRRCFHWNHFMSQLLIILLLNEMIIDTWQQIQYEHIDSGSQQQKQGFDDELNYRQDDKHTIVKRKLKMKSILGGKSKSKPKSKPASNPYPKQPAYNPGYGGSPSHQYPKQPSHNPNFGAPPSSHSGYPAGPPPAYPGLNTGRGSGYPAGAPPAYPGMNTGHGYPQQSNYPRYPQQSNYPMHNPSYPGYQNKPGTFGSGGFGHSYGNNYGGYRKSKGLNIGKTIGTAGFGALAGTALGAYGGYKLGKMVGNLGRMGHYGYYSDQGKYIRCDPPKNIKVDPETNISYIPLDEAYDRRCSYFDRPPPPYIEPSMLVSAANSINILPLSLLLFVTIFLQIWSMRRVQKI